MSLRRCWVAVSVSLFVALCFAPAAHAQHDSDKRFEIKGAVGLAWIHDYLETRVPPEATLNQAAAGIAGRMYLWGAERGFAVEAEFLRIPEAEGEMNNVFLGNLIWEASRTRARPYLIVSTGLMRHEQRFSGTGGIQTATTNLFSITGGGGLHMHMSDNWVFTPEFRVGQNPRFLATFAIGYEFG